MAIASAFWSGPLHHKLIVGISSATWWRPLHHRCGGGGHCRPDYVPVNMPHALILLVPCSLRSGRDIEVISCCEALCVYSALSHFMCTEMFYLQRLPLKTKKKLFVLIIDENAAPVALLGKK